MNRVTPFIKRLRTNGYDLCGTAFPTVTHKSKQLSMSFEYNTRISKWFLMSLAQQT